MKPRAPSSSQVVFMGMGEPLNNEAAVLSALGAMCDPAGFALAPKGVTVSTVRASRALRALSSPRALLASSLEALLLLARSGARALYLPEPASLRARG